MRYKNEIVTLGIIIFVIPALFVIKAVTADGGYQGVYTDECWEDCLGGYIVPNIQCGCDLMPVSSRTEEKKICTVVQDSFRNGVFESQRNQSAKCYEWVGNWCEPTGWSCVGGLDTCPVFEVAEAYYNSGSTGASVSYCELNGTICNCKHYGREV